MSNDPLYTLIAAMPPADKRIVIHELKKGKKKNTEVLAATQLCIKHKIADDKTLLAHWPSGESRPPRNLSQSKRNWFNTLLEIVSNARSTSDNPVQKALNQIEYLRSRQLYELAERLFDKALKTADELELFMDGRKLCRLIRHIYSMNHEEGFPMKRQSADFLFSLENDFLRKDNNMARIETAIAQRNSNSGISMEAPIELEDPELAQSTRAKLMIQKHFYYDCLKEDNYEGAAIRLERFIYTVEIRPRFLQDPEIFDHYITVIYDHGILQQVLGNLAGSKKAQQKLKTLLSRFKWAEALILPRLLLLEIDFATFAFDEKAGQPLSHKISALKASLGERLGQSREVLLQYRMGYYYLFAGQPRFAQPYLKFLIQYPNPHARPDLQAMGQLLQLVSLHDSHDFEGLRALAKSSTEYLEKMSRFGDFEKLILAMLMQLAKGENLSALRVQFKKSLNEFFSIEQNKSKENYFDFEAWLSAAEAGVSIMNWLRNNK